MRDCLGILRRAASTALTAAMISPAAFCDGPFRIDPAKMSKIGTVDERFQSFNIEMVEVTGGRFWAPYKSQEVSETKKEPNLATPGIDPSLFRMRTPIDLSNSRLRKLAAALGPTYLRVSGTWENSTYFQDSDGATPSSPPPGFGGILTRAEWRGVIDFARVVNAKIVTSFAISDGVRDAKGVWTPDQARRFLAFTKADGAEIAAAEFFNEPSFASMGGAPKGYDAAAYVRDFGIFRRFVKDAAPGMLILGPGSIGEAAPFALSGLSMLKTEDMLAGEGSNIDALSYHFYGALSKRCAVMPGVAKTTPEAALSQEWLSRTDRDFAYYAALRDRFAPGKPIWLTETGQTACGGDSWASTFIDSFRYLDQLGRLAKRGVQVVAHNTLNASDYGVIDEETLTPRPNYWSAVLWRRTMGTTVLDAGASPVENVHLYAHCLRTKPGGVAVLAINLDRETAHDLSIPGQALRYTLTASDLLGSRVELNGRELKLGADDAMPALTGVAVAGGRLTLPPASITFVTLPGAGNSSCR